MQKIPLSVFENVAVWNVTIDKNYEKGEEYQ